jgi:Flp pilus assembly protein TadB
METVVDARREVALELEKLAQDFERSDEAALLRTRITSWVVAAVVTVVMLILLIVGGDWRYLGFFWLIIVGLTWMSYMLSSRRQRQQTERLRALASRWLQGQPPAAG